MERTYKFKLKRTTQFIYKFVFCEDGGAEVEMAIIVRSKGLHRNHFDTLPVVYPTERDGANGVISWDIQMERSVGGRSDQKVPSGMKTEARRLATAYSWWLMRDCGCRRARVEIDVEEQRDLIVFMNHAHLKEEKN